LGAEGRNSKNAAELQSRDSRLATIARIAKTNLMLPDINIKRPIGVEPLEDQVKQRKLKTTNNLNKALQKYNEINQKKLARNEPVNQTFHKHQTQSTAFNESQTKIEPTSNSQRTSYRNFSFQYPELGKFQSIDAQTKA